jgi:hypothetical protein
MHFSSNIADRLTQSYTLNVHDESHQKKYSLKFLGSKTVLEVKTDVYTLTDIPVRHQVWTGWPSQLKSDRTTLACSGIKYPAHEFTVKRAPFTANSSKDNRKVGTCWFLLQLNNMLLQSKRLSPLIAIPLHPRKIYCLFNYAGHISIVDVYSVYVMY